MFVDEVMVKLYAGKGGDGCTSFRREKFVPMGGPDGGNGGRGASIVFEGDKSLRTLVDLKYQKIIKAPKGENGKGSNMYGKSSEDVIVKVPLGTVVLDIENGKQICDILKDKEKFVIAKGGRGGRGNKAFATHDTPAPSFSEKGEPGEEKYVKCELKTVADVGLIGMPSVGKSTILSLISGSHPKIAAYHFTTLSPNIGVVKMRDNTSFVVADLPGLIEGASEGIGLGDKFLKHASRNKILAHVVDMGAEEGRSPIEDYKVICSEVAKYDKNLAEKEELIIASKMDLPNAKENLELFKKVYPDKKICPISAVNMEGIEDMITTMSTLLKDKPENTDISAEEVVYKYEEKVPYTITKNNDLWVISGEKIEKLFKMTNFDQDEGALMFAKKIERLGIEEELKNRGAKPGDEVSILDFIFELK